MSMDINDRLFFTAQIERIIMTIKETGTKLSEEAEVRENKICTDIDELIDKFDKFERFGMHLSDLNRALDGMNANIAEVARLLRDLEYLLQRIDRKGG